jgi:PhzF family phenazine biosynthesis protein
VLFTAAGAGKNALTFKTLRAGDLVVKRKKKGRYTIDFPADKARKAKQPSYLAHALGQEPVKVLAGTDDLLVVLNKQSDIKKLAPDLSLLAKVRKRGVIVTAPGKQADFVSRCFYPRFGIAEDPVTGSAHTLLIPYWSKRLKKKKLTAIQLSERKGKLTGQLKGNRVLLNGGAVTYLTGEIRLPD